MQIHYNHPSLNCFELVDYVNFAIYSYNVRICVLSPVLFLCDTFIVPCLKNRSKGVLRGPFFHAKNRPTFWPVFL